MKYVSQSILLIGILSLASCAPTINVAEETTLANSGDPVAQFRLGMAYQAGIGTQKDIAKAIMWYRKSAEQGNADAQYNLALLYLIGEGVPQDSKQAVFWFQKSADQGDAMAQNYLAIRYLTGDGVDKDTTKALYWYEEAAKNGNPRAMKNLGEIYASGREVEQNYIEAYKWLDLARFYTQSSSDMNLKWSVRGKLDEVAENMTESEIHAAKRLATEWDKKRRLADSN